MFHPWRPTLAMDSAEMIISHAASITAQRPSSKMPSAQVFRQIPLTIIAYCNNVRDVNARAKATDRRNRPAGSGMDEEGLIGKIDASNS